MKIFPAGKRMKPFCLFLGFCLLTPVVKAQMTAGLTGKPDTSFTNYSAFKSAKKKYPQIRLVEEQPSTDVKEEKSIIYFRTGGRELRLDAFCPAGGREAGGTPAVLIIHGGGWRSGNRSQHIPLAQRLAAKGLACFTVEYRLSTEALYPAAVYDLKEAVRWIRKNSRKYHINPEKIAALGFSAGGELAAFLGATNGDKRFESPAGNRKVPASVNAVVDIDGTLSFVHSESGEGDDTKSISAATYWFGYKKAEKPELWKDASPLTHAGKTSPPFLFINSSVDRMHAGRDDFRKILQSFNVYSEVQSFPDSPHTFCLFEPWFDPTVNYISSFLDKVFGMKR